MEEQLLLFRKMLETTRKLAMVVKKLHDEDISQLEDDEDSPALGELAELLANRQLLIDEIGRYDSPTRDKDRNEIKQILTETVDINAELGEALKTRQKDLRRLLLEVHEGKKILSYLRQTATKPGKIIDRCE